MSEAIKMTLLQDNKHLGKKGGEFEVFSREQADYFTKAGIASVKGAIPEVKQPEQEPEVPVFPEDRIEPAEPAKERLDKNPKQTRAKKK